MNRTPKGLIPKLITLSVIIVSALVMSTISAQVAENIGGAGIIIEGEQKLWHRVTLTFDGPMTSESDAINPFTDYRMDVTFTNGNTSYTVPGYYAADGNAANTGATSGNKWRVHFTPDVTGTWTYTASFVTGDMVALNPANGTATSFNGMTGSFIVEDTDKTGRDFRAHGILRYVGDHYLQFAGSGEYYLKSGADSPENFLGYDEFDGTYDTGGIINNFLHSYATHGSDWNPGDPEWANGKGHNIIGALNYIASQNVNSVYLLTYNIDSGDGADTWPWTTHTERQRFDVSKLDQWEIVFSHMTKLGIQIHLVTQENENDQKLGGNGNLNDVRKLYYRELVARFSHHPALQWNIGEENDNTDAQRNEFSQYIRSLDPYDHPTVVHTYYNLRENFGSGALDAFYDGLIGSQYFEATSLQGDATNYNRWAVMLRDQSSDAGQPWVIYGDEQGPRVEANMSNINQIIRDAMWGNLLGGGAGVEWYFGYQGCCFGDMQSDDWRVAEPLWQQSHRAVQFMRDYVPFTESAPNNSLLLNPSTTGDAVLAKAGDTYVVLLRQGTHNSNPMINLQGDNTVYRVGWFDPRGDTPLVQGSVTEITGGSVASLGNAPYYDGQEWIVLLTTDSSISIEESTTPPPTNPNSNLAITRLVLVDANTNTDLFELTNGMAISLSDLPTQNLNVRADTNPAVIGSVRFGLNNDTNFRTESVAPYAMAGDSNGDYIAWTPTLKPYTITATPYSEANAGGNIGTEMTVTINFVEAGANQSPRLSNPGNQSSAAGAVVNLPITVSDNDGDNVTCSATGLPTGLAIDSNCHVSGTVANTCTGFQQSGEGISEENGLLIVDVDYAPTSDYWTQESAISGAIGNSYYEWRTGNTNPSLIDGKGKFGILQYPIQITTPGIYRFQIHASAPHAGDFNDIWVRFSDASTVFGIKKGKGFPVNSNASQAFFYNVGNGWFKAYHSRGRNTWEWETRTKDEDPHFVFVEFASAGSYMMELSGRSAQFKIDRLVLWQSQVGEATATNLNQPSSVGTGTIDSCLYNVEVIAVDDGVPVEAASTTFNWVVDMSDSGEPLPPSAPPTISQLDTQTSTVDEPVTLQISATDPDGESLTYQAANLPAGLQINPSTGLITGSPTAVGDWTVIIEVTDTSNLSSTMIYNWAVVAAPSEPVPPTITQLAAQTSTVDEPVTLQISATDPDGESLTYQAANLPAGLQINPSTGLITGSPTTLGDSSVTITVSDTSNLSSTMTYNWTIVEGTANPAGDPNDDTLSIIRLVLIDADTDTDIMELTNNLVIDVNSLPSTNLNVRAETNPPLVGSVQFGLNTEVDFNIENAAPYAMAKDSSGDYWEWQPALGSYIISATPYDERNKNGEQGQSMIVSFQLTDQVPANLAPQVTAPPTQTTIVDTPASLQIQASDPENTTLTYTAIGLPDGLQINGQTGLISGTPILMGQKSVQVVVFDASGLGSDIVTFDWLITADPNPPVNEAPQVTGIPTQSTMQGTPVSLQVQASDPEGSTLIYSATGLPAGLYIDSQTGVIAGAPTTMGQSTVQIVVFDMQGAASDPVTFGWTITNPPPVNQAPQVTSIPAQSTMQGSAVSLPIQASDPEGSTLIYSATGLPTGLYIDSQTGVIAGAPTSLGLSIVEVVVFDAQGLASNPVTFGWTITDPPPVNQAPQITPVVAQSTMQGTAVSFQIQASDPEGSTLSYAATGLPAGLQIDFATGLINGTPTTVGPNTVHVTVYDSQGLGSTPIVFAWTIITDPNNNPPPTNIVGVTAFTLVNADTNTDIMVLTNGATIYLDSLPTQNLNVRAEVSGQVNNVRFKLNGQTTITEGVAPYAMYGDFNGDYNPWTPPIGTHILVAIPYLEANTNGGIGETLTITFNVEQEATGTAVIIEQPTEPVVIEETETPPPPTEAPADNNPPDTGSEEPQATPPPANDNNPRITRFMLVNADTNQDIMQLTDGIVVNLNNLPTLNVNIRADVAGTVRSVKFKGSNNRMESAAPFALFGDDDSQYRAWTPSAGNFIIKATPYTEKTGKGTEGTTVTISIQFSDQ